MNRLFLIAVTALVLSGCSLIDRADYQDPFYAKYLNTGSMLDEQISATLEQLRQNPDSPTLHNELGSLLVQ